MHEVMMFNETTREQRYMSNVKRDDIDKLKGEGWIEGPRLIEMHNPQMNHTMPVLHKEQKAYEDRGYYANPTLIYHPTEGTRKVSGEDAQKAIKNRGWYASPAHFPGNDIGAIKTPNVMKEAS